MRSSLFLGSIELKTLSCPFLLCDNCVLLNHACKHNIQRPSVSITMRRLHGLHSDKSQVQGVVLRVLIGGSFLKHLAMEVPPKVRIGNIVLSWILFHDLSL